MPNKAISLDRLKDYDKKLKELSCLWNKSTSYSLNDIVSFKGTKLKCTTAGISANTTLDLTTVVGNQITDGTVEWEVISVSGIPESSGSGLNFWQANTNYEVDDIVVYNNIVYKCITAHTSTSTFDDTKFTQLTYELATDTEVVDGIFGGAGV